MNIKVNGTKESIEAPITLLEMLQIKSLDLNGIVVLLNDQVISKQSWGEVKLQDDDSVEILRFLGGG